MYYILYYMYMKKIYYKRTILLEATIILYIDYYKVQFDC